MKFLFLTFLLAFSFNGFSANTDWESNCPEAPGCEFVGKTAYNNAHWLKPGKGRDNIESIPLGVITGVIWRPEGALIGFSEAIPDAGIKEQARTAPEDAWYYIIKESEYEFIRKARDIKAK